MYVAPVGLHGGCTAVGDRIPMIEQNVDGAVELHSPQEGEHGDSVQATMLSAGSDCMLWNGTCRLMPILDHSVKASLICTGDLATYQMMRSQWMRPLSMLPPWSDLKQCTMDALNLMCFLFTF